MIIDKSRILRKPNGHLKPCRSLYRPTRLLNLTLLSHEQQRVWTAEEARAQASSRPNLPFRPILLQELKEEQVLSLNL